jgi:hypothetical protein
MDLLLAVVALVPGAVIFRVCRVLGLLDSIVNIGGIQFGILVQCRWKPLGGDFRGFGVSGGLEPLVLPAG